MLIFNVSDQCLSYHNLFQATELVESTLFIQITLNYLCYKSIKMILITIIHIQGLLKG